ncbi:MAG: dihydroxyacetone kinase subunit DhaL [Actinomycetota bacterium]
MATGGASDDKSLDSSFVVGWIRELADQIRGQRDYLTQLDAAIGDADHGINMDRGMTMAVARLGEMTEARPGAILVSIGDSLVLGVGGAAGPLYGTGLRSLGKALGDEDCFGLEDLLAGLRSSLQAIQSLGAASVGDKTIVDAFAPAVSAFERALRAGGDVVSAATRAREAAEEGARSTIPLQARKGRASYLGPRSVGHQDPGATSTALVFTALERAAAARPGVVETQ